MTEIRKPRRKAKWSKRERETACTTWCEVAIKDGKCDPVSLEWDGFRLRIYVGQSFLGGVVMPKGGD